MKYSYQGEAERTAKAGGKEINVSRKKANEVCAAVRGMMVDKAIAYLERVKVKKDSIPYRRYNRKKAHRTGGKPGGYPEKAVRVVQQVIENGIANAEYKGFEREKMKIVHATAYKKMELDRIKPKGRSKTHNIELTNIEIVLREV